MALAKARQQFGKVIKDKSAFKYKYAPLDKILEVVDEPLFNNKLAFTQIPVFEDGCCGGQTILMHESGAYIEMKFIGPAKDVGPQDLGKLILYYRRYSFISMVGVVPSTDDDDGATVQKKMTQTGAVKDSQPNKTELMEKLGKLYKGPQIQDYFYTTKMLGGYGLPAKKKLTNTQAKELLVTFSDLVGSMDVYFVNRNKEPAK